MPIEFLDLRWQKKNKRDLAPNIINMIDRFNYISSWVATTICTAENIKDRKRVLKRYIDITISLKQIHNYNGMMEIWSGISRGPIYRLKRTLSGLKKKLFTKIYRITRINRQ